MWQVSCVNIAQRAVLNVHLIFYLHAQLTLLLKREQLWNTVLQHCPAMLAAEMNCMNTCDQTCFVLTGLNNTFVIEWLELYQHILEFIYTLYTDRIKLHRDESFWLCVSLYCIKCMLDHVNVGNKIHTTTKEWFNWPLGEIWAFFQITSLELTVLVSCNGFERQLVPYFFTKKLLLS